ncbi:MAG: hypothetical protein R3E08_12155 [Thiotrichaceae bacterium]
MTPPELPKPVTPLEEQQVIAQQLVEPPLQAALKLLTMGIQKYYNVLIQL